MGSSEEARQIGKTKEGLAKREVMRLAFWERLLVRAESKTQLHANISAGPQNWISATAGRNGFSYQYWVVMENADVQFYIDTSDEGVNVYYFEMLHELKSNIDEAFGEPLLWEPMEGRQACRVRKWLDSGGLQDEARWPQIQDKMIDAMVRMEAALKPHIAEMPSLSAVKSLVENNAQEQSLSGRAFAVGNCPGLLVNVPIWHALAS